MAETGRSISKMEQCNRTPLGMVMRKTEPRSVIVEKCFAEARQLFAPNTQA